MMFNIHNVRVQWDIMPMAYKIADISGLLIKEGQDVSPKALSAITGVRLPTVKRCLELLDLPERYRDLLMAEAEKPKGEQKITADLFIEINKSYNVVERYVPETASSFDKAEFVDSMVDKYVSGSVGSVTAFRDLSKLARAERAGVDREEAVKAIKKLVHNKRYSVEDAYRDTVEIAYEKRDLLAKIEGLRARIADLRGPLARSRELVAALRALRFQIDKFLK
jgi:DNA-binding phage protein